MPRMHRVLGSMTSTVRERGKGRGRERRKDKQTDAVLKSEVPAGACSFWRPQKKEFPCPVHCVLSAPHPNQTQPTSVTTTTSSVSAKLS